MAEMQGKVDFGSSQREVRVSEGSSYRESTVIEFCVENVLIGRADVSIFF